MAAGLAATLLQAALLLGPALPQVDPEGTSFLTLHLLLELFAVTVSLMIAATAWHAHGAAGGRAAGVVVGGFAAVALCDLVHALTYEGMPPFMGPGSTPRAIYWWLAARGIEVATVLLMLVPLADRLPRARSLAAGGALVGILLAWDLAGRAGLPALYVPGQGVTPAKTAAELAILAGNMVAAVLWWRRAARDGDRRAYMIATACWIVGIGELSFAGYLAPSDFLNVFGHAFKVAGYALLYAASVVAHVRMPYEAMQTERRRAEDSERRLRALGDNLPHTIVYQLRRRPDGTRHYVHVSDALERVLALDRAAILADPDLLVGRIHPDDLAGYRMVAARAAAGQHVLDVTVRVRHGDGGWRWMHIVSAPRPPESDGSVLWDGLSMDVTRDREAEQRHRENEALLAAVIHSASDAIVSTDAQGRITLFNPAAERIFGHDARAMLGQPLDRLLPAGEAEAHGASMQAFAAAPDTSRRMGAGRVRGRRADGTLLELEASISQTTVNERRVLTAILRDVTERVRTERALLQSQVELTELTHRLMDQEKQTARRLAQVLHDQLGQTLTAMRIDFVADARFADPREAARHARVDRLIDQAVTEVRQVLVELRPTLLDERGLVEALHNELQTRRRDADEVHLTLDAAPALETQRWPPDVEYAVFMIAREAVGNALRHARAAQIELLLSGDERRLRLEIRDDGLGLAPGALESRPGHLGVVGMRERAIAIGGRFEVASAPDGGTSVIVTWEDPRP